MTDNTIGTPGQPPSTTVRAYDHDGNVAQVQQPNGDATFNSYELADQIAHVDIDAGAVFTPMGQTQESYSYDNAGTQISSLDFDGRRHSTSHYGDMRLYH